MKDTLSCIPNKIEYEKYKLSNGLTVVLVPDKKLTTVMVDMYVKVGSQYESDDIAGISHFLEHMGFKGTTTHPNNMELIMPLDSIGSSYNAGTGHEVTDYYVKCGFQYVETAINFISDIYQNSVFPEAEFEKEKGVILEEIRMYEDLPQYKVEDVYFKALYGEQSAGRSIAGDEKTVKNMTRKDLVKYYQKHYNPKNSFLFIAGNYDKKEVKKLISKYFKGVKKLKESAYPKTKVSQKEARVSIFKKDTAETHFILGFNSFPEFDEKNYTLDLLDTVLSGGFTSRLWQLVREKLGGAYYINSETMTFFDRGSFCIRGGIDSSRAELILTEIVKELRSFKEKLVPAEELEKAKKYLIGKMFMRMDQPYSLRPYLISPTIYGKPVTMPRERLEKKIKVTSLDLQKMAKKIFTKENINLAMVTSLKNEKKFKDIINKI